MPGPLHGLRVVDLTIDMAGPLAGMMLADAGAEVIKVEPPGGDPTSRRPGFVAWNRGKQRRTCDLDRLQDRDALDTLLRGADVVLVGTSPGAITHDDLASRGLVGTHGVLVVICPYLPSGTPWAGGRESAALVFAAMGHAWGQSSYDDVPVDSVYPLVPCLQGIWAATVAVAAARSSRRDGHVRTAMVGGAHAGVMISPGAFSIALGAPVGHRPGGPGGSIPNYRCYRCSDGEWLFLGAYTAAFIRRALGVLGLDHLLDDGRIAGEPGRVRLADNFSWVTGELARQFSTRPRSHWIEHLQAADVPVAPTLETADWLHHPQVVALGLRAETTDDRGRRIVMPGVPISFGGTPVAVSAPARTAAVPLTGAVEPWSEPSAGAVGPWSDRRAADGSSPPSGTPSAGLLTDIRVLDLGTIIAGPYAGTMLAELGAEVVKVERPPLGDEFRHATGGQGRGGFDSYNRNQLGVAVDLGTEAGRSALGALVADTDVIIDNFRPGVLGRLGLDWATLAAGQPGLVSVSITAFGGRGPLGPRPGFDPVVQALSGIMRTQGGNDPEDSPAFLTVPINDVIASALAAFGVCAALLSRDTTGRGQPLDVALVASSCLVQIEQIVEIDGVRAAVGGGRDHRGPTPLSRLYQAVDGWIRLAGDWPSDLGPLRAAGLLPLGAGDSATGAGDSAATEHAAGLLPPGAGESAAGAGDSAAGAGDSAAGAGAATEHAAGAASRLDAAGVVAALADSIGGLAVAEVVRRVNAAGVAAVAARTLPEVALDRGLREAGVVRTGGDEGRLMEPGRWCEIPGQSAGPARLAPAFGEHTSRLLRRAHFDHDRIAELFRSGAVAGD